jgi:hypothetical protein
MREAVLVAANLFEEPFGGHAIEFREFAIEHDLGTANSMDGQQVGGWCGHRGAPANAERRGKMEEGRFKRGRGAAAPRVLSSEFRVLGATGEEQSTEANLLRARLRRTGRTPAVARWAMARQGRTEVRGQKAAARCRKKSEARSLRSANRGAAAIQEERFKMARVPAALVSTGPFDPLLPWRRRQRHPCLSQRLDAPATGSGDALNAPGLRSKAPVHQKQMSQGLRSWHRTWMPCRRRPAPFARPGRPSPSHRTMCRP